MAPNLGPELAEALAAYDFGGPVIEAKPYGQGHINNTFAVSVETGTGGTGSRALRRFLLQRINTHVFRDPVGLIENITGVTAHLKQKIAAAGGDPDRETLTVVPTNAGLPCCITAGGGTWRAYTFIEGAISFQRVTDPAVFTAAAGAFGRFAAMLADYPAASLHVTIPRFHDTRARFQNLVRAAEADTHGRAQTCRAELAFALARKQDCGVLMDRLDTGKLPLRVTHNDTKLNNVLIDPATKQAVCVIDLDTVMPGLLADDFGDAIRTGANTAEEDERDLGEVNFDLDLYKAYSGRYLQALGGMVPQPELESLPWGARLMTYENGIRFLTDYLAGDTYYKTDYDTHNLSRARVQFRLLDEMEAHWTAMREVFRPA